jgi:PAS domain S-box-containing protein
MRLQNTILKYLFAVSAVLLTFALRMWLTPVTGTGAPFVLFFAAVLVTSLVAGAGPGVCAVLLSVPFSVRSFMVHGGFSASEAAGQTLLFAGEGLVIVYLTWVMKKRRQAVENINQQLRESEERFRLTMDEAPIGMALASLDGRLFRVNRALCDILGYSAEELVTFTLRTISYPGEDQNEVDSAASGNVPAGSVPRRGRERRYVRKDGRIVHATLSGSVAYNPAGEPLYHIIQIEDISERKRIENEQRFLAEVGTVLTSSLDYEETLANIAQLAVRELADFCLVDIIEAPKVIRRLKVFSRDPQNAWICELFMQVPLDKGPPPQIAWAFEHQQTTFIPTLSAEHLARVRDEAIQALRAANVNSVIAVPLRAHGKKLGVLTFLASTRSRVYRPCDVRLAEELARRAALSIENAHLFAEAQNAIKTREDVLAIVSHDLKNPLTRIDLVIQLLRRSEQVTPEHLRSFVDKVQRASVEMNALISDLLDFARIQSGTFAVIPQPEQLHPIVLTVVERMRVLTEGKQQRLDIDLPETIPLIAADAHRLGQVLSNLLGNAIKFTPPQGRIRISARLDGHRVVISVSDTGPGIPQDNLSKVFDRFWQAPETRQQGSGLGLSIAKGIVQSLGGDIWAESQMGAGTSFFFTVPLADLDSDERRLAA